MRWRSWHVWFTVGTEHYKQHHIPVAVVAANHTRAFVQSALTWSRRLSTPSEERDLTWRTIHRQSRECKQRQTNRFTVIDSNTLCSKECLGWYSKKWVQWSQPIKKNVSPALQTVVDNSILLPLRKDYISVDHIELKLHNQSTTQLACCIYPLLYLYKIDSETFYFLNKKFYQLQLLSWSLEACSEHRTHPNL